MDTTTILPNLHHDHQPSTNGCRTTTTTAISTTRADPLASKLKCVRKKKSGGKKDRQSKIHTAQGLRDRRMRLSVHTARKFFDLNDMLGFDKASKTIEWLFSKSHEAIQEVTETLQSESACETSSMIEIAAATEKDQNLKLQSDHNDQESVIKNLGKTKQISQQDSSVDFHQSQLGFSENRDDHNMKESSCYPLEFSNTYHFLKHLHLDNTARNTDAYMGNITVIPSTNHSIFDYNKTDWLNSRNPFLGFLGGWNSENPRMESNNRIVPNISSLNVNMNRENPNQCSAMMSSNFISFNSENQGE